METSKCPKCGTKQEYHGTCRVNPDGSEVKMTVWHCGSRQIVEATGEVDWRDGAECKGLAFKAYTHERMDKLGAPHTVEDSEHTKAGCRIGGRFDWVEAELARLKSEKAAAERDNDAGREVLRRAWREFNAIRARDGAPAGVCHDYWNEMTESLHALVGDDDAKPWMTKATRELVRPYENRNADLSSRLVDAELALTAATSRAEALEKERDTMQAERMRLLCTSRVHDLEQAIQGIKANSYLDDDVINRHQFTTTGCEALRKAFALLQPAKEVEGGK